MTGSTSSTWGPRRWTRARTGATSTRGMRSGSRRRHMARRRRPMVSTLGLTRSKGSVSQAGKTSTSSSPRKARRSWARRSASGLVGTATTSGWRPVRSASPAIAKARAGSATASTADDAARPARPGAGWWRRRGGRSWQGSRAPASRVPAGLGRWLLREGAGVAHRRQAAFTTGRPVSPTRLAQGPRRVHLGQPSAPHPQAPGRLGHAVIAERRTTVPSVSGRYVATGRSASPL